MNNIKQYIQEKLILNKSVKKSDKKITDIDNTNSDMILSIIKSVFISIYKNKTYKIKGLANYHIVRTEINWEDIIKILDEEYNYKIDSDLADKKQGKLQTTVRKLLDGIEKLINMKSLCYKSPNNDETILIKGSDLYWNDWKNYTKKYNINFS